jgi:hypothetical protein
LGDATRRAGSGKKTMVYETNKGPWASALSKTCSRVTPARVIGTPPFGNINIVIT